MQVSTPGFDLTTFDSHWADLDPSQKSELISRASLFPKALGILPILKGLFSYHYNIREAARKSLGKVVSDIGRGLEASFNSKAFKDAEQDAARVAGKIYLEISSTMAFPDKCLIFSALMDLGDPGAFVAFKALYQDRISMDIFKRGIQNMTETQRLALTEQYIQATPEIRLRFAGLFKGLLKGIQDREAVMDFYACLFDKKQDVDPFLNNIAPELRDPNHIVQSELGGANADRQVRGVKALSMIQSRVSDRVLKTLLMGNPAKKVRMAVYSLIENSSMGLYPDMFDTLFHHIDTADTGESMAVFKALVVSGKYPFHELIRRVREKCPGMISLILLEISDLTRLSFFAVQDIAMNKDKYQGVNFDINEACIFGMIKKRPERVVKLLHMYQKSTAQGTETAMASFIAKTTRLLLREREHIEQEFKAIEAGIVSVEAPKPMLKNLFGDPVQKKLAQLKERTAPALLDFSGVCLKNENLSECVFSGSGVMFTKTIFDNCNLSDIQLSHAGCRNTVFYNVNMDGAQFHDVCLDNAVFVNVSAAGSQFKKCSFQGASFFNCNFNGADLSDSLFMDAVISKTTFAQADLTCASFTYAKLSGVSFVTACLALGDFTGVNARFSRFPADVRSTIRAVDSNFNDREFQLSFNDLPNIEAAVASEINMMIFCEFIHYGEAKFMAQNKQSLLMAYDVFKGLRADFFQLLPVLLHENIDMGSKYRFIPETPMGIADYLPSRETLKTLEKYIDKRQVVGKRNFAPAIQALFSMGSVGSLAQTAESDIDYWVCIDEADMEDGALALLREKLDALERMALEQFKVHVTFFIVDILKAQNNDFGGSTQESSGSAQSRLLKEEFYRTMIHVAGRLPLWAVLPTTISLNYYNLILDRTLRFKSFSRYMNLGDIHAIPVNEYFGASIWQMFKWLKSPFKSVIKMALLEKYIHSYGQATLLCNQYKNEWMNSGSHLKPGQNDSYIIMVNHLIEFYKSQGDEPSIKLLLTCFFLKLGVSKQSEIDFSNFGLRKILLDQCLAEWGWYYEKMFDVGRFKQWPYAAIHRLSTTIERYMVSRYKALKQGFDTSSAGGVMISEDDRIVLERKVNIEFQDKPDKIKKMLLVSRGDRHFSGLHIKYLPANNLNATGRWALVHKVPRLKKQTEEIIIEANVIEEIGAWLIHNRLYTDRTMLGLVPNATFISHDDIEKLCRSMNEFLSPELDSPISFSAMRKVPVITRLFLSLNFYTQRPQVSISDFTAVYLNSWGEMYLKTKQLSIPLLNLNVAKQQVCDDLGIDTLPVNTAFYFSRGMARSAS
ncbi:MAG: adenylate cyclase [Desulfobacterales bacterium]|nr:MAG: adenylate cyclase [Desulfobacterales bacterium]